MWMRAVMVMLLLLMLAGEALAGVLHCDGGLLADGQTGQGVSANYLAVGHRNSSLAVQYIRNGGTATVKMQICCADETSACTPWLDVVNSSKSIDGTTTTDGVGIDNPACLYRANVTACTSCDVDVAVRCGPRS